MHDAFSHDDLIRKAAHVHEHVHDNVHVHVDVDVDVLVHVDVDVDVGGFCSMLTIQNERKLCTRDTHVFGERSGLTLSSPNPASAFRGLKRGYT